jgi:hypothetical protein
VLHCLPSEVLWRPDGSERLTQADYYLTRAHYGRRAREREAERVADLEKRAAEGDAKAQQEVQMLRLIESGAVDEDEGRAAIERLKEGGGSGAGGGTPKVFGRGG